MDVKSFLRHISLQRRPAEFWREQRTLSRHWIQTSCRAQSLAVPHDSKLCRSSIYCSVIRLWAAGLAVVFSTNTSTRCASASNLSRSVRGSTRPQYVFRSCNHTTYSRFIFYSRIISRFLNKTYSLHLEVISPIDRRFWDTDPWYLPMSDICSRERNESRVRFLFQNQYFCQFFEQL